MAMSKLHSEVVALRHQSTAFRNFNMDFNMQSAWCSTGRIALSAFACLEGFVQYHTQDASVYSHKMHAVYSYLDSFLLGSFDQACAPGL